MIFQRNGTVKSLIAIAAICLTVSGCGTISNCRAQGGRLICDVNSTSLNRVAAFNKWLPSEWVAQTAVINPSTFDATLLKLSLAGTNVPLNVTSGQLVVTLYQGNTAIASSVHGWIKSSSDLIASNPGALTAWVRQYPNADGYDTSTTLDFNQSTTTTSVVAVNNVYNGAVVSGSTRSISPPLRGVQR